ncbi:hypothetical protein PCC7424_5653 (plasmid) [Gloeothece citriformis PCC 7424]|uniref:Uncharacterized protein n=1 Tax=Gloeothece citriformis (strain PCC 7424) TaxID=65393 RepID=B7KLQ3_GLOC7|nr:hypothetical protein [Gloeothece citriformis]ACK73725.1 hypothetical protein PCC7424_5653 [Gloeothece citriformis PCC 7424]
MAWEPYNLDQKAHDLVLSFRDKGNVIKESHKMRVTVAYGLERFWGEQFRLRKLDENKAAYWQATWQTLVDILQKAGINLPNDSISPDNTESIKTMTENLWNFDPKQRKVALAILTNLCDIALRIMVRTFV